MMPGMSVEEEGGGRGGKAQSAMEYLMTYSWSMLIIVVVLSVMFILLQSPSTFAPATCAFTGGAYCQDVVFGSNSANTLAVLLLTNSQSYPITNPQLMVNYSGSQYVVSCIPSNLVLEGGAIICSVPISASGIPLGSLASGKLLLSEVPCINANFPACSSGQAPQAIDALLTLVTEGMTPRTVLENPLAMSPFKAGISLACK